MANKRNLDRRPAASERRLDKRRGYEPRVAHEEDCAHEVAPVGLDQVHEVLVRDGGS